MNNFNNKKNLNGLLLYINKNHYILYIIKDSLICNNIIYKWKRLTPIDKIKYIKDAQNLQDNYSFSNPLYLNPSIPFY